MTAYAKNYVTFKWTNTQLPEGAGISSVQGLLNSAMTATGLNEDTRQQVIRFWLRAQQDPWVMDHYLRPENGRTYADLTGLDYVLEFLDQRITGLFMLDRDVNQYI